ncbi:MAG: hypothetical protein A2925_02380 [Candidatus Yanofskybacteria bacterium RIFCSPLOWO2_01_FULL_44_22]|uniref:Uncharacterized protein n=1 Tax=Candidatus Yanofskybacteria bacterium RIFCSPLOWO2_01_FULL_44_22 TaxID=1802697 RepID=A0A1F8GML9_9BACT|nr:MAG: hypothetical protein A2925_02380 [Candidatus Yanofskybacteria bacterium RIFCSPLOWO2_01_FULL_44_22]
MTEETRTCQNCKNSFVIEPEDFAFYEKMKVPPPTWCPECRLKRRMLFRNEMTLYKRKCDFTGETIFSGISRDKPVKVYKSDVWFSDKWDPMDYGREYDFSRSFFRQFKELYRAVPQLDRSVLRLIDSDYCINASDLKSCYLLFNAELSEDSAYGDGITNCKNVYDSYFMKQVERAYEGFVCLRSYNVFFSSNVSESHDVYFSKDLIGCEYCFGCVGLRHKKYMVFNKPYSKEEYFKKLSEFNTGSHKNLIKLKSEVKSFQFQFPAKFMHGYNNENVSGDYITNSHNVNNSFFIDEFENCKYCYWMGLKPIKDCYDFNWGGAAEMVYEAVAVGYEIGNVRFVYECWPGLYDSSYCMFCSAGSAHLFGCVGLRNKQYCILNKQYSKDEYEKLVPRIIQQMSEVPYKDQEGRVYKYGEFFPSDTSLFAYNETIAQEYFPLIKEEALAQKYVWKDPEERSYKITMQHNEIPDSIYDTAATILKEIIGCEHEGKCKEQCTIAFKIIPTELEFLKASNLSLPRLCPSCRHYQRVLQRNPPLLWKRKCGCTGLKSANGIYENQNMHSHGEVFCSSEFETSYAPDRPEIVYCEQCYQTEVV